MTTLDRLPRVHSELNVDIREPFSDPLGSGARTNQRPCSACSVDRVHAVGDGAFARFSRERQHELAQFETIWETMDRVAPFVMALSLWELGFLRSRSQAISAGDIAARTCSPSRYKPLIAQWLRMLTREDLAQRVMGGRHDSVSAEIDIARAQREVSNAITALDITTRYPGFIEYFKTCVAHQTDLLRGRAIPQKLLFPGGNSRIVDGVYRDNPAAALQNSVLAAIVGAIAIDSFYGRPLRILEVGAGTGATTAAVAHAGAAFDHYCFTDISGFFIRRASRRFGNERPFSFRILDIDRDPVQQGFDLDSFDIVIAANALHTAKHVDATLRQLHTVLAPSGFVVAIETTRNTALQMITFGHFQGVCHYEDQRRVSNMPFLSVAEWQHALRRVGFREARGVPAHIGGSTGWTQHVLLAQKAAG